jgi:hypothetical protein
VTELDRTERVARHISKGKRKGDEEDGTTGIVDHNAFMPRADWPRGKGLEEYLSITRVDHFPGDMEQKLAGVTAAMRERIQGLNEDSRLGILSVETIHEAAALKPKKLSMRIVNAEKDASYAGIYGMDLSDVMIAQELARRVLLYRPRISVTG